jgi:chromosome partitioning protein
LVYQRVVPTSVKFREAYARGIPLIHYDRLGAGAEAYRAAARAYLAGGQPGMLSALMNDEPMSNPPADDEPMDDEVNPLLKAS